VKYTEANVPGTLVCLWNVCPPLAESIRLGKAGQFTDFHPEVKQDYIFYLIKNKSSPPETGGTPSGTILINANPNTRIRKVMSDHKSNWPLTRL